MLFLSSVVASCAPPEQPTTDDKQDVSDIVSAQTKVIQKDTSGLFENVVLEINDGDDSTTSAYVYVLLQASCTENITHYLLSSKSTPPEADDERWIEVETPTTDINISNYKIHLQPFEESQPIYAWLKSESEQISSAVSDTIILDTLGDVTAPISNSILINNGDSTSSSATVTIGINASDSGGIIGYFVSESLVNVSAINTEWTLIADSTLLDKSIDHTFSVTSGSPTVYIWYLDSAGNISIADSDSITLAIDFDAPTNSQISINNGLSWSGSENVTLSIEGTDNYGITSYYLGNSATKPAASAAEWVDVTSTTSYSDNALAHTLENTNGSKTVYLFFKDAANHISEAASASITLYLNDLSGPTSPSVVINNGDTNTASNTVNLSLSCDDDIGVVAYFASEINSAPTVDTSGWVYVNLTGNYSSTVSKVLTPGSGLKTIYLWFRDPGGNITSVVSDSITLD